MPKRIVLIPTHFSNLQFLRTVVKTNEWIIVCPIHQSRFVWREIHPCVFGRAPGQVACRFLDCLEDFLRKAQLLYTLSLDQIISIYGQDEPCSVDKEKDPLACTIPHFYERQVKCRNRKDHPSQKYTTLILPESEARLGYSWEERLILLEHDMIRAQSIAGLYSTLGGGYFMTRRLQTANALAREQKRVALLLGNKEMYYKCTINQAYSEIYRGRFKMARMHILQVWVALANEKHFDEKEVLQNMCRSAMLFRKRVRMARREVPEKRCALVDDFSRIRVVQDQSSQDDLRVAPFVRAKI